MKAIDHPAGTAYVSKPYKSMNDDLYKIAIAAPIYDGPNSIGIVAASVATDSTRAIEAAESLA